MSTAFVERLKSAAMTQFASCLTTNTLHSFAFLVSFVAGFRGFRGGFKVS
jgi:hypothetical protein